MPDTARGVVGLSTEAAAEAIASFEDDCDSGTVREALDTVTSDGRVTREAIREAVSDTAMLVSTAETRVELAGIALEDARERADYVADLDVVAARLDTYADRFDAVESRVRDLGVDLPCSADEVTEPDAVYELALRVRDTATRAQGVVRTADDLQFDLEQFESWLDSPNRRYDEFAEDVDLVRASVAELEAAAAELDAADDPEVDWADATMRARVVGLLVADLRVELADLRTWADREDAPFRPALESDLEALDDRQTALADRLAATASPAWRDRFGDDIDALAADLAAFDPPVAWERVEQRLATHRERAFGDG